MNVPSTDCPNCGATIDGEASRCDRCGEARDVPGSGRPRFSVEAREAGWRLGGLLKLYPAGGAVVRYVGWCPAGAFGLDHDGNMVWLVDWGYMGRVQVAGAELLFEGRPADVDTGRLL